MREWQRYDIRMRTVGSLFDLVIQLTRSYFKENTFVNIHVLNVCFDDCIFKNKN